MIKIILFPKKNKIPTCFTSATYQKKIPAKPVGQTLQRAGLLSVSQVSEVLQYQAQNRHQRFGEILVLWGWLKQETYDFFAEQLPRLASEGCQKSLGEYLKSAGLLDQAQVDQILQQQPQTGLSFGELAVLKGWVKQETIDVFLEYVNRDSTSFSAHQNHASLESRRKRLIDIMGASVGLGITALLFLPLAIAIRVDSPGPIFYSQSRIGFRGKRFQFWKFRSMYQDADKRKHLVDNQAQGYIFKNENDPRITRVGRFLRRTSLDELPQFWNVLKGEMSLVGTRPPTFDEVIRYEPHHFQRLKVKPGITGEWQVNGRSSVKDFDEIVAMDLDYQRKWSVGYDLHLIGKTISVVFHKNGAC
jgi:lipopolysaccharide/colanic/teichoic acid biosynthesis glycosyltransferase